MSRARTKAQVAALQRLLRELGTVRVAVSGGVDSLTLGILAGRTQPEKTRVFHAVSPAVPPAATARVKAVSAGEGWQLSIVDAGEFVDEDYRSNPYVRCFHCKKNLYAALSVHEPGVTVSGTNLDDLKDFRPGLQAAERFAVRHPFAECGVDKASIRRICRLLGYEELSNLPASPCLSSRVQTGLRIDPGILFFIDRVESRLRDDLRPEVVRCRIRSEGVAVQLDPGSLDALTEQEIERWKSNIGDMAVQAGLPAEVRFENYRMGSAFVSDV